jgi:hypothetical protein
MVYFGSWALVTLIIASKFCWIRAFVFEGNRSHQFGLAPFLGVFEVVSKKISFDCNNMSTPLQTPYNEGSKSTSQ